MHDVCSQFGLDGPKARLMSQGLYDLVHAFEYPSTPFIANEPPFTFDFFLLSMTRVLASLTGIQSAAETIHV